MTDPVCDKEGNTFERSAIESWLSQHGTSPLTRTTMTIADLVPNRALKDAINAHLNKKPAPSMPESAAIHPDENIDIKIVSDADGTVLVRMIPPEGESRPPVNIVCVIDVSGIMMPLIIQQVRCPMQ